MFRPSIVLDYVKVNIFRRGLAELCVCPQFELVALFSPRHCHIHYLGRLPFLAMA